MPPRRHASSSSSQTNARAAAAVLKKASRLRPALAIVLGSGFHHLPSAMRIEKSLAYTRLPGFPRPTVGGHAGQLHLGTLAETPVMVLSGRSHYYEGLSMGDVTFYIHVLAAYGISSVLLTNAAGGVNPKFRAGDFMVVTDHINLMGENPLRGPAAANLPPFVDLSCAYDPGLRSLLQQAAANSSLSLRSGIYLAVSGPNYETPAEIRAFATLGADAVGMSTVPEALVARRYGLRVAALSCITNQAAGLCEKPLSHAEVLETAEHVKHLGVKLLTAFAQLYAKENQT